MSLNERWSTFIENFGYFNKNANPAYYIDTGVAYLINSNLQLDFSATGNLNSFLNNYSINAGVAWRILRQFQK